MSAKKNRKSGNPAVRAAALKGEYIEPKVVQPKKRRDLDPTFNPTEDEVLESYAPKIPKPFAEEPEVVKHRTPEDEKIPVWMAALMIASFLGSGSAALLALWGGPGHKFTVLAGVGTIVAAFGVLALVSWILSFFIQSDEEDRRWSSRKIITVVIILIMTAATLGVSLTGLMATEEAATNMPVQDPNSTPLTPEEIDALAKQDDGLADADEAPESKAKK